MALHLQGQILMENAFNNILIAKRNTVSKPIENFIISTHKTFLCQITEDQIPSSPLQDLSPLSVVLRLLQQLQDFLFIPSSVFPWHFNSLKNLLCFLSVCSQLAPWASSHAQNSFLDIYFKSDLHFLVWFGLVFAHGFLSPT